jgi:hypothetical protein
MGTLMADIIPGGYNDPDCEGNQPTHHTGEPCIEKGCDNPASTAWGPYWCFTHNVERIDRINHQLGDLAKGWKYPIRPEVIDAMKQANVARSLDSTIPTNIERHY